MERDIRGDNFQDRLFSWLFGIGAYWFWKVHYGGVELNAESQQATQKLFRELAENPQRRKMSEDAQKIFVGFERDFKNLGSIPQEGPLLILSWHYPEFPLSYWGTIFLISEAIDKVRKEEICWLGSTRFRLPHRDQGLAVAKRFWRRITEDCYGGVYFDYKGNNLGAIRRLRNIINEDGIVGLMPDDIDKTMSPPQKIERLNPQAVGLIRSLTKRGMPIVAAIPSYFAEDQTLALDFIPITERPDNPEGWEKLIKETLTAPISP